MSVYLSQEDDRERIGELIIELDAYCDEVDEKYGSSVRDEWTRRKNSHNIDILKIIGFTIVAIVVLLVSFEGFMAGVTTTIGMVVGVALLHSEIKNEPKPEDLFDPRSDEEKSRWKELQKRYFNRDYDRQRWAINHDRCGDNETVLLEAEDDMFFYDGEYGTPWELD